MNTTIYTVRNFPFEHPQKVQTLLDAADKLEASTPESPSREGFLDPRKVIQTVEEHAEHALATGDAREQAVRTAGEAIASALIEAVRDNLDHYLNQLRGEFDQAAVSYTQAAQVLPADFTAQDLPGWEPETFDAYQAARSANQVFEKSKQFLLNLGQLVHSETWNHNYANEFLLVNPDTLERYIAVQTSTHQGADRALGDVNPVLLHAVQDGAELRVELPSVVRGEIAGCEQERAGMQEQEFRQLRAGVRAY